MQKQLFKVNVVDVMDGKLIGKNFPLMLLKTDESEVFQDIEMGIRSFGIRFEFDVDNDTLIFFTKKPLNLKEINSDLYRMGSMSQTGEYFYLQLKNY